MTFGKKKKTGKAAKIFFHSHSNQGGAFLESHEIRGWFRFLFATRRSAAAPLVQPAAANSAEAALLPLVNKLTFDSKFKISVFT